MTEPLHSAASPRDDSRKASPYEGLQGNVRDLPLPTLETFMNQYPDRDYHVTMTIPEFNCICPLTGLPDFATLRLDYVPDHECVELKSFKLYLTAFRNQGIFHEHAVNKILADFVRAVKPRQASLEGEFNARGGIQTTVRADYP